MKAEDFSKESMEIFLPIPQLVKTYEGYRMSTGYRNLSYHDFKANEVEFLCECYYSGEHSLIGTTATSANGLRRLTTAGIADRYGLNIRMVHKWLRAFERKARLIEEMMEIINGELQLPYRLYCLQ